jgi:uncharacterized protein
MPQTDAEVIRNAYAAFGRQDIPAVLGAFDEEIDFHAITAIPNGGPHKGHDEVASFFQSLGTTYEELRVELDEVLDAGSKLVGIGHLRGTARSTAFETPFVHVWTMRDGRALHMQEYIDPEQMLRALGWTEPAAVAAV